MLVMSLKMEIGKMRPRFSRFVPKLVDQNRRNQATERTESPVMRLTSEDAVTKADAVDIRHHPFRWKLGRGLIENDVMLIDLSLRENLRGRRNSWNPVDVCQKISTKGQFEYQLKESFQRNQVVTRKEGRG